MVVFICEHCSGRSFNNNLFCRKNVSQISIAGKILVVSTKRINCGTKFLYASISFCVEKYVCYGEISIVYTFGKMLK